MSYEYVVSPRKITIGLLPPDRPSTVVETGDIHIIEIYRDGMTHLPLAIISIISPEKHQKNSGTRMLYLSVDHLTCTQKESSWSISRATW